MKYMLAKGFTRKRRKFLPLFLLTGLFMAMLLQALPHHHHDDARLCMGNSPVHCETDSSEAQSCEGCCDIQVPCGVHFDIQKPPLQQASGKPQVQLVAILLPSDNSELSPTGLLTRGRAPSFLPLYTAECTGSIGLRAPPVFVV